MSIRSKILLSALVLPILPMTAWATNGYFSHGTSVAEKGLAGAGVAYSQDTLSAANNPAGMVWQGGAWDIGAALFSPIRKYTVTGGGAGFALAPGTYDSENELFVIPQFGYNWAIGDKRTIGISVYGNGGMNTEWKSADPPGTFGAGVAGVNLEQLFISTTYSAKFSERSSWGISAIAVRQTFEATGVGSFAPFSTDPTKLSNNGDDTSLGLGARLGVQLGFGTGWTFGAAYQPKIKMDEFDSYAGLFAEKGGFDIPETWTLGLAWEVNKGHNLVFDVQQINYSGVAAISNPIASLVPPTGSCPTGDTTGCLGGSSGAGFGWQDMTVYKLGYEWASSDAWAWRVGYSFTDQPIPTTETMFNILAPGVVEQHFTFGFTRSYSNNNDFNFALMYAPSVSVKGANPFIAPGGSQDIELEMYQYELAFSYSKHF
jgi:long-chain fatty acid transport protein